MKAPIVKIIAVQDDDMATQYVLIYFPHHLWQVELACDRGHKAYQSRFHPQTALEVDFANFALFECAAPVRLHMATHKLINPIGNYDLLVGVEFHEQITLIARPILALVNEHIVPTECLNIRLCQLLDICL